MSRSPSALTDAEPRVLVGGVGYANLRDLSVGPLLVERNATLGEAVDVEDLSYGPIDVLFLLQRRAPYAGAVFVSSVARGDAPGTVRTSRWDFPSIPDEDVQGCVAEAVTGVISLDNLLHICGYFKALPADVTVIEVEPEDQGWGEGMTATGERGLITALAQVRSEIGRILT